eukprot:NODE_683_length_1408_cov_353.276423.p1 GENE.NODE_683_length_1408_cov_353.276423~~NODE_683_length_1408_cov_353.276423.p1  ORF type:complete len:312 (-),score=112.38 NODE_683_length_1408_cov_353.276423:455-1390(-)
MGGNRKRQRAVAEMTARQRAVVFERMASGGPEAEQVLLQECPGLKALIDDPDSNFTDLITIRIEGLKYRIGAKLGEKAMMIESITDIQLPQGAKIAVFGPHASGKSMLLELMAGIRQPSEGLIFVPGHLMVLHVSQAPTVLSAPTESGGNMGLLKNLIFGRESYDMERVKRVLTRLGMQQHLAVLKKEMAGEEVGRFWSELSYTNRSLLHLARALIADPEVLVLQKPFTAFDFAVQPKVQQALEDYISNRGLEVDARWRKLRRPRTIFFTTNDLEHVMSFADHVLLIKDGKVREVKDYRELKAFEFLSPKR